MRIEFAEGKVMNCKIIPIRKYSKMKDVRSVVHNSLWLSIEGFLAEDYSDLSWTEVESARIEFNLLTKAWRWNEQMMRRRFKKRPPKHFTCKRWFAHWGLNHRNRD